MYTNRSHIALPDVLAMIEQTAEQGSSVALDYVRKDGHISTLVVQKRHGTVKATAPGTGRGQYMMRDAGLIRIIDQMEQQPKSLLIHAIIGFSPDGRTNKESFYPVFHGRNLPGQTE